MPKRRVTISYDPKAFLALAGIAHRRGIAGPADMISRLIQCRTVKGPKMMGF